VNPCAKKTVNHCKALKNTACKYANKIKKLKKKRGPEWMWKKKYSNELSNNKSEQDRYNNLKELNKNYRERLAQANKTSGDWLIS
jgi:hypothetical protein